MVIARVAERLLHGFIRWRIDQPLPMEIGYRLRDHTGKVIGVGTRREMQRIIERAPRLSPKDRQLSFAGITGFMPQTKRHAFIKAMRKGMRSQGIKWSKPIERPKAEQWQPRKGEVGIFCLQRIITGGQFGTSYVVQDVDSKEEKFLPNHGVLNRLLEAAKLKTGAFLQIKCLRKGSRKPGDYYDYELRTAKGNAPF